MTESKHFLISGRVQGVSYRASACQKALDLGLRGWVRNLPDGRVEALAAGPDSELQRFERWLWQGPAQAEVTNIEFEPAATEELEKLKEKAEFKVC